MNNDADSTASVKTVVAISREQQAAIEDKLAKIFDRKISVVNEIDKKILGGFTIRLGDWYLDASLANDLRKIKESWKD